MKKILVLFLFVPIFLSRAEEVFTVKEISFIPVRHYVGDVVELRVRVIGSELGTLRPPDPLPQGNWLDIKRVICTRIRKDDWEVRVEFTTFKPGSHLIPPLDLDSVVLPEIRTETRSILEDKDATRIEDPKGQLFLPGTWLTLTLWGFLLFGLPPIAIVFFRGLKKAIRQYRLTRDRQIPRNRIHRILRKLRKESGILKARSFFIILTSAVREYLTSRLNLPAETATTEELEYLLPQRISDTILTKEMVSLFSKADLVKFGGISSREKEMISILDRVDRMVEKVEELDAES